MTTGRINQVSIVAPNMLLAKHMPGGILLTLENCHVLSHVRIPDVYQIARLSLQDSD